MKKTRLASLYYTAVQAREILDFDERRFQYWVSKGDIPKVMLSGRKQGVYPKRDIDALALALTKVFEYAEGITYEFSRSTPGDQVEEMDIGIRCFGSEFITPTA